MSNYDAEPVASAASNGLMGSPQSLLPRRLATLPLSGLVRGDDLETL